MDCTDAIYSDSVVDYIVENYMDEVSLRERYQTDCYQLIDSNQAVIYDESKTIDSATLLQFGYLSMPACYGLMDQSALEVSQVLKVRQQPYLGLYGQGILIGVVDTGERVVIMSAWLKMELVENIVFRYFPWWR